MSLKIYRYLLLPLGVWLVLTIGFATTSLGVGWEQHIPFLSLPYVLFAVNFGLGLAFLQTRVSFLGLFLATVTYVASRHYFHGDVGQGRTLTYLASFYAPTMVVLYHGLNERGVFTLHGLRRFLIILSSIFIVLLLPKLLRLEDLDLDQAWLFFRPVGRGLRLPVCGFLLFLFVTPALLIRRPFVSPLLGPLFAVALLYLVMALNVESSLWRVTARQGVFTAYMTGVAVMFLWAILDSSWRSANMDELTELPGRRLLKHHLARLGSSYVLAVADIDFFKKINDKYGHDTGDQVLRFLASHLRRVTGGGIAYRFGGEEFVIVFDRGDVIQAAAALDELRQTIEGREFVIRSQNRPRQKPANAAPPKNPRKPKTIRVTVSIGVAGPTPRRDTVEAVMAAADKALYVAKGEGRNRVCTAK